MGRSHVQKVWYGSEIAEEFANLRVAALLISILFGR